MDRNNIEKIAQTPEDKLLLAKVWDKINAGVQRNIMASTGFLTPRELQMCRYLFGDLPGLTAFGGYDGAERQLLVYLPDYLDGSALQEEDGPVNCIHGTFHESETVSHRDLLGALMGAGIGRETVGDILVGNGCCDFFVTAEIAAYVEQNFDSAGRTRLRLERIGLAEVSVPEAETKEIKDTLASLRLDSVISSGFRIGRSSASDYVSAGRVAIDGLPCEKPDKAITEGTTISVRGLGKIKLTTVNGQTKKGRISVVIHRYV